MAKSLRSKHKRRMRAIKRVRYGEKELKRLQEMVKKTEEKDAQEESAMKRLETQFSTTMDTDNAEPSFIKITNSGSNNPGDSMETDQTERSKRTLQNKFGQYPEWMNSRRLKKQKDKVKRLKKNKAKKLKK